MRWIAALMMVALAACETSVEDPFVRTDTACYLDLDGDGFGYLEPWDPGGVSCDDIPNATRTPGDCDDSAPDRNPGATDTPDDWIDQDCDGIDAVSCMPDLDGDGVGAPPVVVELDGDCDEDGLHYLWDFEDCDDADAAVHPAAVDVPGDGVDQNCDGEDGGACWYDGDGDGWGAGEPQIAPDGTCDHDNLADQPGDCDDSADWINPDQVEVPGDGWDQDCSGADAVECGPDEDGDGYPGEDLQLFEEGPCPAGTAAAGLDLDCDDGDPAINPGAWDQPDDGVDSDCSEFVPNACYEDHDGDGVGDAFLADAGDCDQPGQVEPGGDCDDDDDTVHPGAEDVPLDGIDQNCNGFDAIACYADDDNDAFGGGPAQVLDAPSCGWPLVANNDDCDDNDAWRNPASYDYVADGIDQDCNGVDAANCFVDLDGDGFGTAAFTYDVDGDCTDAGQAEEPGDCDDADPALNPGATDLADDGVDQDCSGSDAVTCYEDADGDGYGGLPGVTDPDGVCWDDPGQYAAADDCDDAEPLISPSAVDLPGDGVDQDCNGVDAVICYSDWDQDGYGAGPPLTDADGACTGTYQSDVDTDCDDSVDWINPAAPEIPADAWDSDCDGDPES